MPTTETIELPSPLAAQVKALATRLSTTPAAIIKGAFSLISPSEEERDRITHERIATLDPSQSIPHEAVVAWAKNLKNKDAN